MAKRTYTIQKQFVSVSQNSKPKNFVITKKIAKHGKQAIIIIPRVLKDELKPDTLVKLTIDVIEIRRRK